MSIGVRIATANPLLAEQFKKALDFWTTVLDLEWHDDDTATCSIQLVDGPRDLFEPMADNMVARSQFPDRRKFQGSIAFNSAVTLNKIEQYRIAVHELGHVFGLRHSFNTRSLMFGFDLDCSDSLDADDLASLAAHHTLRTPFAGPIKLKDLR